MKYSRYSPGNLDVSVLQKLFVGSESALSDVLQGISLSASTNEKRSALIVGGRGVGKSHLAWLVYKTLVSDEYQETRQKLKIALIHEDQRASSFVDLLLHILQSFQDASLQEKIERIYQAYSKDPPASLQLAKETLVTCLGDLTLLLLCEDLQSLLEALGEEGQQSWRAFIDEHPSWTILATSPKEPPPQSAFAGFFTVHRLERLDAGATREILRRRAELDEKPDVATFLTTLEGQSRARAIHYLLDGQPRLSMILSDFLSRDSLHSLRGALLALLDSLSPYYEGQLRQLAPLQQKMIALLCQETKPLTIKRVAERCLISQQSAAKQMSELFASGFIQKTPIGRESYCELKDPLLRACFEMRSGRAEHFGLFVDVVRAWFGAREMPDRARLMGRLLEQKGERLHLEIALLFSRAGATHDPEFADLFASMLLEESLLKGPPSAVNLAKDLRKILEENQRQDLSCATLIRLLQLFIFKDGLDLNAWDPSLSALSGAFSDLRDCVIPIQMMQATVRYLLSQDKMSLLALTLAQRNLLLEALADKEKSKNERANESRTQQG